MSPDGAKIPSKATIKRSRKGCHTCKRLKIKCDESKPRCFYCSKNNFDCDYSLKLTWGGRPYKDTTKRKSVLSAHTDSEPESGPRKRPSPNVQFVADKKKRPNRLKQPSISSSPRSVEPEIKSEDALSAALSSASPKIDQPRPVSAFPTANGSSLLSEPKLASLGLSSRALSLDTDISSTLDSGSLLSSAPMEPSVSMPILDPQFMARPMKHADSMPAMPQGSQTVGSPRDRLLESPLAMLANITDLSQGVESLSSALEKIPDIQSSEIFSNFLNTVEDRRLTPDWHLSGSELEKPATDDNDDDFLSDYSADLAKIEAYSPTARPNFFNEFHSSLLKYNGSSNRVYEIDDLNSMPLDFDNSPQSVNSAQATSSYYFDSIPPSLLPLPEILNQVPHYRQLMHFWLNVASDNLVPAPAHIYKENPFKVLLPQMAMEYPAVLTTLLAFAATWMATVTGKDQPIEILNQLVARSCKALVKMLKDKDLATSDGALATVLLFSCYECIVSHDFDRHRAHTIGARQIIMARKAKQKLKLSPEEVRSPDSNSSTSSSKSTAGTEGDITFFLMRWFVYIDVIGALSATKRATDYLAHQEDLATYEPAESVNMVNALDASTKADPKRDIDHILGFDVKFLPQLTDIVILIRRTNAYLAQPGADASRIPIAIITKALEVKEQITTSYEEGEARRQERLDEMNLHQFHSSSSSRQQKYRKLIKQDNVLRSTNKLFSDMGLLNLYRRVLKIPRESSIIQNLASGMGRISMKLESKSSAEICTIFCNFCAACETVDDQYRQFYFDRFTKLTELGNVSAIKSLQIMQRCWKTGEDWIEAANNLDIDLTLL